MSLKIMKGAITEGILGAILDSTDAKKYMALLKKNTGAMANNIPSPSCTSSSTLNITSPRVFVSILCVCVILV
jgi:hypothetical protein